MPGVNLVFKLHSFVKDLYNCTLYCCHCQTILVSKYQNNPNVVMDLLNLHETLHDYILVISMAFVSKCIEVDSLE